MAASMGNGMMAEHEFLGHIAALGDTGLYRWVTKQIASGKPLDKIRDEIARRVVCIQQVMTDPKSVADLSSYWGDYDHGH